jgi:hypothetical protein
MSGLLLSLERRCVGELQTEALAMDAQWIEPAIKACLQAIHAKLREAELIARAAAACAEIGKHQ